MPTVPKKLLERCTVCYAINVCIMQKSILLSALEDANRLQIAPLCQSEACAMLPLHVPCRDRPSLLLPAAVTLGLGIGESWV